LEKVPWVGNGLLLKLLASHLCLEELLELQLTQRVDPLMPCFLAEIEPFLYLVPNLKYHL
jgi:hypothetical protein